jgi:hypothetical protein
VNVRNLEAGDMRSTESGRQPRSETGRTEPDDDRLRSTLSCRPAHRSPSVTFRGTTAFPVIASGSDVRPQRPVSRAAADMIGKPP